jgi:hypothetical protein
MRGSADVNTIPFVALSESSLYSVSVNSTMNSRLKRFAGALFIATTVECDPVARDLARILNTNRSAHLRSHHALLRLYCLMMLMQIFAKSYSTSSLPARVCPPCVGGCVSRARNPQINRMSFELTLLQPLLIHCESEKNFKGELNSNGQPHGRGLLKGGTDVAYTYIGEFRNGRAHGLGLCTVAVGAKMKPVQIRGQFALGRLNGLCDVQISGKVVFVGEFEANLAKGVGEVTSGAPFQGNFLRGVRCGFGVETMPGAITVYKGEFVNDRREGNGIVFAEDGDGFDTFVEGGVWQDGRLIAPFRSEADAAAQELFALTLRREQELFADTARARSANANIAAKVDEMCVLQCAAEQSTSHNVRQVQSGLGNSRVTDAVATYTYTTITCVLVDAAGFVRD